MCFLLEEGDPEAGTSPGMAAPSRPRLCAHGTCTLAAPCCSGDHRVWCFPWESVEEFSKVLALPVDFRMQFSLCRGNSIICVV